LLIVEYLPLLLGIGICLALLLAYIDLRTATPDFDQLHPPQAYDAIRAQEMLWCYLEALPTEETRSEERHHILGWASKITTPTGKSDAEGASGRALTLNS